MSALFPTEPNLAKEVEAHLEASERRAVSWQSVLLDEIYQAALARESGMAAIALTVPVS